MFYRHLQSSIEALLFASRRPAPAVKLGEILNIDIDHVHSLIAEMSDAMNAEERGLIIVEVAGGYQLCTKPSLINVVSKLAEVQDSKLSAAAMETLAIVAFKRPVTKQEIEAIRGVKADRAVTTLLDRMLIKEVGRKEAIGRPILYGTTNEFLQCFGLKSLSDLPDIASLLPDIGTAEKTTEDTPS